MERQAIGRREFLRASALGAAGVLVAACTPTPTAPTEAPAGAPTEAPVEATEAPVEAATEIPTTEAVAAAEAVELIYWHGWSVEHEAQCVSDMVDLFNEAHTDIHVQVVPDKTSDALMTAIAGGNPPDVGISWSGDETAQWRAGGLIMDLDDIARSSGIDDDLFVHASIEACKMNGKTYFGLPIQMDAFGVYYNKGLLRDAGLDPDADLPKTLEDVLELGLQLTQYDDAGNITTLGLSLYSWMWEAAAYLYGGRWWDPTTAQPTADDPANIEAFTALAGFYEQIGAEKLNTFNSQQADNPLGSMFLAGKVAICWDGDWVIAFLKKFAPDVEYGIFALPPAKGHEDMAYSAPIALCVYAIPEGVKNPAESWEFIHWMATTEAPCCLFTQVVATSAALKSVNSDANCWPDEHFQYFSDLIAQDKLIAWPPIPVARYYMTEFWAAGDRIWYGEQTVEESLGDLQQKVLDELAKTPA